MPECVRQAHGDHFREFVIPHAALTYYVWVEFAAKLPRVKSIHFSFGPSGCPREGAERFEITGNTVDCYYLLDLRETLIGFQMIAWWFREDRDIIRFSNINE